MEIRVKKLQGEEIANKVARSMGVAPEIGNSSMLVLTSKNF
jgi:hypothetical protein